MHFTNCICHTLCNCKIKWWIIFSPIIKLLKRLILYDYFHTCCALHIHKLLHCSSSKKLCTLFTQHCSSTHDTGPIISRIQPPHGPRLGAILLGYGRKSRNCNCCTSHFTLPTVHLKLLSFSLGVQISRIACQAWSGVILTKVKSSTATRYN